MTAADTFTDVLGRLSAAPGADGLLADHLATACAAALGADGAGLSYSLLPDRRLPLGASDARAAAAERLQYATGEGPCLDAQRRRTTVIAPLAELTTRWPGFTGRLVEHTPYRCVIALPVGGPLSGVVAIDLYLNAPGTPGPETTAALGEVADLVGHAFSDDVAGDTDLVLGLPSSFRSLPIAARHRVWLAIGYVSAHAGTNAGDALSLLRATAFTHDLDLETTASRVLSGELPLLPRDRS